jgi:hypothetical protein
MTGEIAMNRAFLLAVVSSVLSCGAAASPNSAYTLYYLDQSSHVCVIELDSSAHALTAGRRISRGRYGSYSVSPDGKRLLGFVEVSREEEKDTGNVFASWRTFLESPFGGWARRELMSLVGMPDPGVEWTPRGDHLIVERGLFDVDLDLYAIRTRKVIAEHLMSPPVISSDGRFLIGADGSGEHYLLFDLNTDKKARIAVSAADFVWVGGTHRLAWTGDMGYGVWVGEIKSSASGPKIVGRRRLTDATCDDLRYVPGKGVYWVRGRRESAKTGWYSSDLRTVHEGALLPPWRPPHGAFEKVKGYKGAVAEYAQYSPDKRFIAYPVRHARRTAMDIRILDRSSRSFPLVAGTLPQWKGCSD